MSKAHILDTLLTEILSGQCTTRQIMSYIKARHPRSFAIINELQSKLHCRAAMISGEFPNFSCQDLTKVMTQPILATAVHEYLQSESSRSLRLHCGHLADRPSYRRITLYLDNPANRAQLNILNP